MEQLEQEPLLPLSRFGRGDSVRLHSFGIDFSEAQRLREMGLCEGKCLNVLRSGDRLIVGCGGCRIALHQDIARNIYGLEILDEPELLPEQPESRLRKFLSLGKRRKKVAA